MLLMLMWEQGRVRLEDRLGNMEADAAADLGRLHQSEALMDARRVLLNTRETWFPSCFSFIGLWLRSMVSVNHDGRGGSATDPPVWDGRGVGGKSVGLALGLMSIWLHCFTRLAS